VAAAHLLGMSTGVQPLAVAALAQVDFRRSGDNAFAQHPSQQREYANLFNPFWQARLVPVDVALGM
jgi:hypothetical protein